MEKTILHKANTRGHADHGWLNAHHTFSFASYHNVDRMHFGVLRVLNDDIIAGGMGFGRHPHDNMEIITIPLSGDLAHQDSMGNSSVIKAGDVQVMSAGTGVEHSEKNPNPTTETKLLQIWLFPNKKNVEPRYGQISLNLEDRKNRFQTIITPEDKQQPGSLWIHQHAWFNITKMDAGKALEYPLHDETHGVYAFVISGNVTINHQPLESRDGLGISNTKKITLQADGECEVLLMEVPLF